MRTCTDYMLSIFEIGDIVKTKHRGALRVTPVVNNGVVNFRLVERTRESPGEPPENELIYITTPTNPCQSDAEYTTSRYCLPRTNLTSDPSLGEFFPPCEDFCCTGGYETATRTVQQFCNCYFEFCCNLDCEINEETLTEFFCTGVPSTP